MIDTPFIILKLYPQVVNIAGDIAFDAEGNQVKIDQSLVDAEIARTSYIGKRQAEYPDFREYLDGIVKGDQAQVQAYIDACNAVKAKYPKGA
jgi:hypothetical protein